MFPQLEVSKAFIFPVNRRHGRTDRRDATLNAASYVGPHKNLSGSIARRLYQSVEMPFCYNDLKAATILTLTDSCL